MHGPFSKILGGGPAPRIDAPVGDALLYERVHMQLLTTAYTRYTTF